jgi:hypothetical protein
MASWRRVLGIVLLSAFGAVAYVDARLNSRRDFMDFKVYQVASRRALGAEPLYRDEDLHFQYKYFPAFAFVMIPFAFGNPEYVKPLWFAISVALFVWFFQQMVTLLPDRRRPDWVLYCWLVPIAAKFIVKELINGQTNVLFGVIVMAGLAAAVERRSRLAGACMALAVWVKPYALIFLPWLTLSLDLSATVTFAVVMLIGLLLPVPIYGWNGTLALLSGWFHTVTTTTEPNLLTRDAESLSAMWAKWIGIGPRAATLTVLSSILVAAIAIPVWRRRMAVKSPEFLEIALLLSMIPLLSPQGWDYVFVLALPAVACLIDRWRDVSIPWRFFTAIAIFMTCLLTFETVGQRLYMIVTTYAIVGLGGVLLLGPIARLRLRALA